MKRKYTHRTCGICPKFKAGWRTVWAKTVGVRAYRCKYGAKIMHTASRDADKERSRKYAYAQTHRAERNAYNRQYRKTHRAKLNAYQREYARLRELEAKLKVGKGKRDLSAVRRGAQEAETAEARAASSVHGGPR